MNIYDSIDFKIIKAIKKISNELIKQENNLVKDYDITSSQFAVLECLYRKGSMCINELIERLISTSGTMTVIIKNLEKKGLITKKTTNSDKRFFEIHLTNEGKKLMKKVMAKREEQIIDFSNTLNKKQKDEFLNLMYKFKERYKVKKK